MITSYGNAPFAIVDLETTGLFTTGHDRVVEVAIVRMRQDGTVEDEFATLVNPERDVGPSDLHGITASDVVHAPTFRDIGGDIAARLRGAIVAGHNLRFDLGFLESEYARMGFAFPPAPSICTLALAYKVLPEIPSRKLAYCCAEAGIALEKAHSALADARATARLLLVLLQEASSCGINPSEVMDGVADMPTASAWPLLAPTGRSFTRSQAEVVKKEERSFLSHLVDELSGDDASEFVQAEYMALLDRSLQDRRVTTDEAIALRDAAVLWGLSRSNVRATHLLYLTTLVDEARSDGTISPAEQRDLELVADLLGIPESALSELLNAPRAPVLACRTPDGSLAGKSVCFTGTLAGCIDGANITREMAESMARAAGLAVLPRVTKKLDILVVADPNTCSGKAQKARDYGTTILAESVFWQAIGVAVE